MVVGGAQNDGRDADGYDDSVDDGIRGILRLRQFEIAWNLDAV